MLTRNDATVDDCIDVIDIISPLPLRHIGFKDVGVDAETLRELNRRIKAMGATSYMEVVSTTTEDCLRSARAAREIGVDRLLGGTEVGAILDILGGAIAYYPFAGHPVGHPTRLQGTAEDVARDCARSGERGCAGVDLLAYRAVDADPLDLARAARAATKGYLIVAGSVDSPARIAALATAGADAFTIGTAAFDGSFSPSKGSLLSQLSDILAAAQNG